MSIRRKPVGTIVVAAALLVPVAQADDWASDGIAASEVADSTHPDNRAEARGPGAIAAQQAASTPVRPDDRAGARVPGRSRRRRSSSRRRAASTGALPRSAWSAAWEPRCCSAAPYSCSSDSAAGRARPEGEARAVQRRRWSEVDRRRLIASSRQDARTRAIHSGKGLSSRCFECCGWGTREEGAADRQPRLAQRLLHEVRRRESGAPLIIVVPLTRRLTNRRLLAVAIAACASLRRAVPASPVTPKDNLSLHEKAGIVELITRTTRCAECDDESVTSRASPATSVREAVRRSRTYRWRTRRFLVSVCRTSWGTGGWTSVGRSRPARSAARMSTTAQRT